MRPSIEEQYPYLISTLRLEPDFPFEEEVLPPEELIRPERMDFMAKLIYIDGVLGRCCKKEAVKIYIHHIRAFGNGRIQEKSDPKKKGGRAYLETFDRIVGLAQKASAGSEFLLHAPVPVDCRSVALDGAHRICASYAFHLKVPIYRFTGYRLTETYDYLFFRRRMLEESALLSMAKKYAAEKAAILLLLDFQRLGRKSFRELEQSFLRKTSPVYMLHLPKNRALILLDGTACTQSRAADLCQGLPQAHKSLILYHKTGQIMDTLDSYLIRQKRRERKYFPFLLLRKYGWYLYQSILRWAKLLLKKTS